MEHLIQLIDSLEPSERLELRERLNERIKIDEEASRELVLSWVRSGFTQNKEIKPNNLW